MLWFGIQNIRRTLVLTSKHLNMWGVTFFVVCLVVNTWFVLFSGILTCSSISSTYVVVVSSLNTSGAACMIVYNCWKPKSCLFLLSFRVWKGKSNIFFCLKTSKYTSQTLPYAFQPPKILHLHGFLHFNLEKYQSSSHSWFLTSDYLIHGSFWVFKALNRRAVPTVFLYSIRKRWSHLSWSSLASKSNSDSLFNDCFTLNILFYSLWGLLTSKYINKIYIDAI